MIAGTAVALPTSTVSAASAQHGAGPGGQTDTYLADALGVTVDELTSAYTAARAAAIDQAVADGLLTREQADCLSSTLCISTVSQTRAVSAMPGVSLTL